MLVALVSYLDANFQSQRIELPFPIRFTIRYESQELDADSTPVNYIEGTDIEAKCIVHIALKNAK